MANPRELAEQAISLLQNALRDSEDRVSELDAELRRKRAPRNRLEEQVEVLGHRLASVEQDALRWQREAGHLEEVLENERAKIKQLKKKLEVAESGPERLTKKEINFWRQRAEMFDNETREYKNRIASLRKELEEARSTEPRDRAPAEAEPSDGAELTALNDKLVQAEAENQRLEARLLAQETQIAELLEEVERLQRISENSAETTGVSAQELEALRRQTDNLQNALQDAHAVKATLNGQLAELETQLGRQRTTADQAQQTAARLQDSLNERDSRVAGLAAELEKTRAELASRSHTDSAQRHELEAAREEAAQARARADELEARAAEARARVEETQAHAAEAQARVEETQAHAAQAQARIEDMRAKASEAHARAEAFEARVADAETRAEDERRRAERVSAELEQVHHEAATLREREQQTRARIAELETQLRETAERAEAGGADAAERERRIEALTAELEAVTQSRESDERTAAERAQRIETLSAELGSARVALAERERELKRLDEQHRQALEQLRHEHGAEREALAAEQEQSLESLRKQKERLEAELSDLVSRNDQAAGAAKSLENTVAELEQLVRHKDQALTAAQSGRSELEGELADAREQLAGLERELAETKEQFAGLEAELRDEKECSENLNQLANERRETLLGLEEKLEEAEERYEEAKWRLGKAEHFERLVRRRKGLIKSLIATLRAKNKANNALKAGLDGLRRFKATAEASQHKLLARIDKLKAELAETREALKRQKAEPQDSTELDEAQAKIATLEDRLNTQAELIQSLEDDLKTAKAVQFSSTSQVERVAVLEAELEAKNDAIRKLEEDADEQQRKLAKLRGSESETMRLKGINEQDRTKIDALEREVAQLREALASKDAAPGGDDSDTAEKLKERDDSIAELMSTVKQQEAQLAALTESAEKWKRKYEFLSTEAPSAYHSVAEK